MPRRNSVASVEEALSTPPRPHLSRSAADWRVLSSKTYLLSVISDLVHEPKRSGRAGSHSACFKLSGLWSISLDQPVPALAARIRTGDRSR
jgi:hypothetical protein